MAYMKLMSMTIKEHLKRYPEDRVKGKTIHIKIDTFEGKRWIDYKVTKYDVEKENL